MVMGIALVAIAAYFIYRWVKYGFTWFTVGAITASAVGLYFVYTSQSSGVPDSLAASMGPVGESIQTGARRLRNMFRK